MSAPESKTSSVFENFRRAVANLERSISTPPVEPRDLSGIIKDFEMAYELSWKALKKQLQFAGHPTQGARDVYRKAYQLGYINDEQIWLAMIEDRNRAAHVYDENAARKLVERIGESYTVTLGALAADIG